MRYLLDTNICIYIIKQKPLEVLHKFETLSPGAIGISSITLSELTYGVQKSKHIDNNEKALQKFISPLDILPFDDEAAFCYGKLRATLEKKGIPIGSMDLLIAAHAQSLKSILVTHNKKEFARIPQLKIEDWVESS